MPAGKDQETVWIGLGSNSGESRGLLRRAAGSLLDLPGSSLLAASSLYRTAPIGTGYDGDFINAVLGMRSGLSPIDLLTECLRIEAELGRDRRESRDRTVDLDILLFGNLILTEPPLILPHPRLVERRFVLEPLAEAAPELAHPFYRRTMRQLLALLGDDQQVERLVERLL